MKSKIIFLLALAYSLVGNAQLSAVDYKSKEFNQFKASKTYVVLTGDAKFDSEIKAGMTDLWKVTPFSFISKAEFEKKLPETTASFISFIVISGKNPGQNYHFLALLNGGKKKLSRYEYDDMLAYCPINFFQNENKLTDCSYRVRNMIESMVHSMNIVQKNDIKGNSYKIVKELREKYNEKAPQIKDRTLLFCDVTLGNKITKSDIAGIYPHKFEICSKEKIEQVIKDKSKEYYYFQPAITMNKSMFVFDPSNGEVLYFDYNIMGLNINTGNIEDLAKAVSPKKKK
ncbi:hypothetical protein [Flavobacterium sp. H122]|uniref:hypothetical protein n=1 Tax=Flavobacterium sp. H122 TaxID=2529860 RepID=UPI0010AA2DFD|nr:hypothetical protein [Flavobacterium sp. H122]